MSLLIGRYEFNGPLINWPRIENLPGIYAVLSFANQEFQLLELGESASLGDTVNETDRQLSWQSKATGMLSLCVHYSPRAGLNKRREIVNEIMREFDGICRESQADEIFLPELRQLAASGSF